jgi:exoribonuclease R
MDAPADSCFIDFIKSWASFGNFTERSPLHGIASNILRATRRYEDIELNQKVGWTFLQEIGEIAAWQNRVPFEFLRGAYGGLLEPTPQDIEDKASTQAPSLVPDTISHLRKDWGEIPVYCIDDAGAREIDDGVSVSFKSTI